MTDINNNSGDCNSGDFNSGDNNSGYMNSGDNNSGDNNSGYMNSGYRNSGDKNSGNCNSGDNNSGYMNSGDLNPGYRNSGNCNSGDKNSGWFNTDDPKMRLFNKDSDITITELYEKNLAPNMDCFFLTKWIEESEMTDEQKKEDSDFHVKGGTLITFTYKEAWSNFWRHTTEENRQKFLNLPNFDADIFKEITGIDVVKFDSGINIKKPNSCEGKVVEIDGKKYKLTEIPKDGEG